jgi:O-antigen/teichoic acid export membrane protein
VICKAVYTDLDKLLLARWTSPSVVGTYAAGYKMLSLSFMPVRAILEATFPRQVQLAGRERGGCSRFTTRLLIVNVALTAVISGLLYSAAPWATLLLGPEFEDSVAVLRIGFVLPVLQAIHYTLGNHFTATGQQLRRTVIQLFVLGVYAMAGLIVIPRYSWSGAIWVSLGCEALLGLLLGIACLARQPRPAGQVNSAPCPQG